MFLYRRWHLVWIALFLFAGVAYAADGSFIRDGVQLHYRTVGTGTPAIILSGGPGIEVDYMVPVGEFLPDSYQQVLYEQRGTGRSKVRLAPETMTMQHVVDDLEALRVHLKKDRLLLIGHS